VVIPYERGDMVSRLYSPDAEILSTEHAEDGTHLRVIVKPELAAALEEFVVAS
jgi:GTP-binding protein HflX